MNDYWFFLQIDLCLPYFSTEDFEIAGGQLQVKFDRIAPNANVSHTVVVKPKKFGYFNFTAAEVSYQPSEDTAEVINGDWLGGGIRVDTLDSCIVNILRV